MNVSYSPFYWIGRACGHAAIVAAACAAMASVADAQIQQILQRAGDGTAYHAISFPNPAGGVERLQITTVGGAISGMGGCAFTGNGSGDPTSAIQGVLSPNMILHPYASIRRTAILNPNNATITFDGSFGGRMTVGSGAGAQNVCGAAFDCMGQVNVQPLVALSSNSGGVPAACIAEDLNAASCDGANLRDAFGFGVAAAGDPPVCSNPANVTVNSTVCAPEPTDGFTIASGQVIIFIYNSSLQNSGFTVGAAGFGISTNNDDPANCGVGNFVIAATADTDSSSRPDVPTATPTSTATNTATNTATQTNTATATPTETNTFTPTNTATPSATRTNTPTATNTPPPTNTRPPIPVIPSPTSPAGLVMIIGLGAGLLWALRRMARIK